MEKLRDMVSTMVSSIGLILLSLLMYSNTFIRISKRSFSGSSFRRMRQTFSVYCSMVLFCSSVVSFVSLKLRV